MDEFKHVYGGPPFGDNDGGIYYTPRRVTDYIWRALRWLRLWWPRTN